jgi:hypothetical protein
MRSLPPPTAQYSSVSVVSFIHTTRGLQPGPPHHHTPGRGAVFTAPDDNGPGSQQLQGLARRPQRAQPTRHRHCAACSELQEPAADWSATFRFPRRSSLRAGSPQH